MNENTNTDRNNYNAPITNENKTNWPRSPMPKSSKNDILLVIKKLLYTTLSAVKLHLKISKIIAIVGFLTASE